MNATDKPDTTIEVLDAPANAPLWRNLIFLRNGKTLWGYHTFTSEAAARAVIPEAEKLFAGYLAISRKYRIVRSDTEAFLYYARDYLYSIPMPWGVQSDG